MENINKDYLEKLFNLALNEDISNGDITTEAIFLEPKDVRAEFLCKQNGIIAGIEVLKIIIENFIKDISFIPYIDDGDSVKSGDVIGYLNGNVKEILKYERILLNFIQRMSGVATYTNLFVQEIKNTGTKILDTRKTIPGWRLLDKLAVKIGGGENHRIGLYDMFLIKDNHIKAAGGIKRAVELCKDYNHKQGNKFKIEVEVRNLDELKEALVVGVDRVMLDNFSVELIKEAVKIVSDRVEIEVSGNVRLENVKTIAECGVDYISVGAITHSAKALDISLEIID